VKRLAGLSPIDCDTVKAQYTTSANDLANEARASYCPHEVFPLSCMSVMRDKNNKRA
jgi:hypothetical protein